MSAYIDELIRPVSLGPVRWNATPAAELLRPGLSDIALPRVPRERLRKLFDIVLMAGSIADDLEGKLKNLVLGAVAYTAVSPTFFGLWGTAASIGDASHGGTAGEITGGAYDRVSVTNNTTNWPSVTTTDKTNGVAITFPAATANWNASANINQVGMLTANAKTSADLMMLWGDLTVPKPVLNLDQAQFAISAFVWSLD